MLVIFLAYEDWGLGGGSGSGLGISQKTLSSLGACCIQQVGRSELPQAVSLSKAREEKALATSLPANRTPSGFCSGFCGLAMGKATFIPALLRELSCYGGMVVVLAGGWVTVRMLSITHQAHSMLSARPCARCGSRTISKAVHHPQGASSLVSLAEAQDSNDP